MGDHTFQCVCGWSFIVLEFNGVDFDCDLQGTIHNNMTIKCPLFFYRGFQLELEAKVQTNI